MRSTTYMYRFLLGMGALFLFNMCAAPSNTIIEPETLADPTTVILVRHAEKDYGHDPNLTEQGRERAKRLAFMLENIDIDAIYSTNTRRTRQTAEPTALAKNLEIKPYTMFDVDVLARIILKKHKGETVLVVGHSNTTPALATLLADPQLYDRFNELDYTNMYIVTLANGHEPRVLKMRF